MVLGIPCDNSVWSKDVLKGNLVYWYNSLIELIVTCTCIYERFGLGKHIGRPDSDLI